MNNVFKTLTTILVLMCSFIANAAWTVRYQHTDVQGSVIAESNSQGTITQRFDYKPFGEGTPTQKAGVGYTGHLEDTDLGLTYMQQRYYDPVIGRFYSNDPVGFTPSNPMMFNRYAYGNNNPYKYTDPDGTTTVAAGAAAGCAASGPACPAGAVVGAVVATVATVAVVAVVAEINESTDDNGGVAPPDTETGKEPDPADKSGELTVAGRAAQKHGSRPGSAFPPQTGNPSKKNEEGQKILEGIVNDPEATSTVGNRFGGTDVRDSSGKGARFDKEGKFRGFLEPNRNDK